MIPATCLASSRLKEGAKGATVTVDEAYIRESNLHPTAQVASGFQPIMPTFQGLVTEEQLLELVEYVKSLKAPSQGQGQTR